jgi:phosphatidylglycerophosphate synthase
VGDTTSLARLVRFVAEHDRGEICIHGAFEDTPRHLDIAAAEAPPNRGLRVTSEDLPEGQTVLFTDRVYDPQKLKTALQEGKGPESAVVWRLDVKSDLNAAADELKRRTEYQPIGRYWAWGLARRLAERLRPTSTLPNHVTIAAATCFLIACGLLAFTGGNWIANAAAALLLAVALVLDTADGHLARLQRTTSHFGRWLDSVLDELCDVTLHTAVAWTAYAQTRQPWWLLLGTLYVAGKYLFFVSKQEISGECTKVNQNDGPLSPGLLQRCARVLEHADIRWHCWIVLAAVGCLQWELLAYSIYYPARAAAVGRRWAGT